MRERQLGRKSAQVSKRQTTVSEPAPWKLLLWTAIAGLVFGLIGFGEIAEDYLRSTRNSLHPHRASGDIVLVLIDDQSLRQVGNWPWRRQQDAVLLDRLTAIGHRQIVISSEDRVSPKRRTCYLGERVSQKD